LCNTIVWNELPSGVEPAMRRHHARARFALSTRVLRYTRELGRGATQTPTARNTEQAEIVEVVRLDRNGQRELVSMRWGLVPLFL
jgi:putative SOS response-associated peptidase YedK